jgi:hypothetical protein
MQVKAGGFAMIYKIDKQIFYTSILLELIYDLRSNLNSI